MRAGIALSEETAGELADMVMGSRESMKGMKGRGIGHG